MTTSPKHVSYTWAHAKVHIDPIFGGREDSLRKNSPVSTMYRGQCYSLAFFSSFNFTAVGGGGVALGKRQKEYMGGGGAAYCVGEGEENHKKWKNKHNAETHRVAVTSWSATNLATHPPKTGKNK